MKQVLGVLAFAALALGQGRTIGTGTTITVRTNEMIETKKSDGRLYSGVVDQDVMDANNNIAIPKGSSVELVVKRAAEDNDDLVLDLDSVTVNGQRYGLATDESRLSGEQRDGIGKNKRTAEYVGGGAAIGAIIGAIAGGGKGAAIGAAAGAGAGAGAQVLTRGKTVRIPAESLLTFRLEQPLRVGSPDNGVTRGGRRYRRTR